MSCSGLWGAGLRAEEVRGGQDVRAGFRVVQGSGVRGNDIRFIVTGVGSKQPCHA